MCLLIIKNTPLSQEWEAYHRFCELWPLLRFYGACIPPWIFKSGGRNINKMDCFADASVAGYCAASWQLWRWWHIDRVSIGTPPAPSLCSAWGRRFLLWSIVGGNLEGDRWRLRASWMRTDEDIWLSAVRGLSGYVRNPRGRAETIGAWSQ